MAEAIFRHGNPKMIDYTPAAGNVTAGQVVLIGNTTGLTCGIAHLDIANGVLGALAGGGGIYDVVATNNYAAGTKVWWDDSGNKVTTTSTNNALFGFTVESAAAANAVIECLHQPYV